jgi:hypothetical protein
MPDTDLSAIIESAVTDICNDARLSAKGQHGDYYRCIVSQAIAAALAAHRQQVAALADATLCGTVAFRGDDGSGESIVAIRFDCRTEADEFVKLLESLGASQ